MWILGSDNLWMSPAPGLSPVSSTPCQSIQKKKLLIPKCVESAFHLLSHSKSSKQHEQKRLSVKSTLRDYLSSAGNCGHQGVNCTGFKGPPSTTTTHTLPPRLTHRLEWMAFFFESQRYHWKVFINTDKYPFGAITYQTHCPHESQSLISS